MSQSVFRSGPDWFAIFGVAFIVLVAGALLTLIGFGIAGAVRNARLPILLRRARVIGRRQDVTGGSGDSSATTWYYLTFELEDGSREEFGVPGQVYGQLVEGDTGSLRSQGTWFKGFDRVV